MSCFGLQHQFALQIPSEISCDNGVKHIMQDQFQYYRIGGICVARRICMKRWPIAANSFVSLLCAYIAYLSAECLRLSIVGPIYFIVF